MLRCPGESMVSDQVQFSKLAASVGVGAKGVVLCVSVESLCNLSCASVCLGIQCVDTSGLAALKW